MKNLVKISVLVIIMVTSFILGGCDKQDVGNKNQIVEFDSVGFLHNELLQMTIDVVGKKENLTNEELYNIMINVYSNKYELSKEETPSFEFVEDALVIVMDSSLSLVEKYSVIFPDASSLEINYMNSIEENFNERDEKFIQNLNQYETEIINDIELLDEQRTSLLIFIDVAEHSYAFWSNDKDVKLAPDFWSIVASDAVGALIGAFFTLPGAVITGGIASYGTAILEIDYFEK